MVTKRTAARLNKLEEERGYNVKVAFSDETRKRWYSVGVMYQEWHQCFGSDDAENIENYLNKL